jgi:peroxiredoxin
MQAAEQTAEILRRMGTIKVGDTLGNFPLEDIDGKLHLLSELVTDKTLITYMKPDCDACLAELETLRSVAKGPDDYEHVILITSANPLHMQRIREDYGLGCVILYDDERQFGAALKIQTFPFNLVVDRDRVLQTVHANTLLPDDYELLFEAARNQTKDGGGVMPSLSKHEPVEG